MSTSSLLVARLLGPDFLFGIALGQFPSARRCVKLFRRDDHLLNGNKWTYRYAFFQLHYLVKHGHIDFLDMKAMAVDERNTADTLSRLLTVWQVLWFSVAEIQRAREGLPTTTLELTALSFVVVMIATSVCWFRKPSISTPQIPTKNGKLIYEIRADAKENTHPDLDIEVWYRTPLDFVRDDRWGIDAHWSYYIRISHLLHLKVMSRPVKSRSWDRFPSDQWLPPEKDLIPFGSLVLLLFSSSFLIAWNFYFPTKAEQWLWRGFAIYHSVFVVYGGVYYLIEAIRWRRRRSKALFKYRPAEVVFGSTTMDRLMEEYLGMEMPLRVIIPVTITCVLYIVARGFLYVEDFVSLRHQPAGIYQTVNKFIPFIGDG
ncbi:hypothetical protein GGR55DRAFT_688163 [Xylaria sp. FL0064]|nr:hypothetical protein GGR55DRAFT_688163 [Xylaria sp. FL0064]